MGKSEVEDAVLEERTGDTRIIRQDWRIGVMCLLAEVTGLPLIVVTCVMVMGIYAQLT